MKYTTKYSSPTNSPEAIITKNSISSIVNDSRKVVPGSVFVAIKGKNLDGNNYIDTAISKGASVIITDSKSIFEKYEHECNIVYYQDARLFLAEMVLYLYPAAPRNMIGVTGTNGKSSVVHFIYEILSRLNLSAATIGTLGIKSNVVSNGQVIKEEIVETNLTTPDTIHFAESLNKLASELVEYCAVEVSSIGIEQKRIYGRKFSVGGFSSFSQDHLDYHGTMKEYLDCKLRFFSENLEKSGVAIVNQNIQEIEYIKDYITQSGRRCITYGNSDADFEYRITHQSIDRQKFYIVYQKQGYEISTGIITSFQIENLCLAIAILHSLGISLEVIQKIIPEIQAPKGRLQRLCSKGIGAGVFIDYAHTPDALERVLKELRYLKKKNAKLICLFGCGGDRDKTKRSIMAQIASKYSDIIIVTDDNPRHENPASIRAQILESCKNAIEIADREEAIKYSISLMNSDDILVIAGKGHESYQIIGNERHYFSDQEVAMKYIDIIRPIN